MPPSSPSSTRPPVRSSPGSSRRSAISTPSRPRATLRGSSPRNGGSTPRSRTGPHIGACRSTPENSSLARASGRGKRGTRPPFLAGDGRTLQGDVVAPCRVGLGKIRAGMDAARLLALAGGGDHHAGRDQHVLHGPSGRVVEDLGENIPAPVVDLH